MLIEGPTGAGKELVAEALHRGSRRSGQIVAVNVSALADGLFEDSLFGHVKGAFTGAVSDHAGYLTEAHDGTCFLDEIGTLSHALQAKLLRVVETRRFRPLGARADHTSNFRLVTATNQNVTELVAAGLFREDLAHRLAVLTLRVPPLTERMEDIPLLAMHFTAQFVERGGRSVELAESAVQELMRYAWPGNVRELRAVVEVAITMCDHARVDATDMARLLRERRAQAAGGVQSTEERSRLQELLTRHEGDTAVVARELGVDRGTVYRWLRQLGIPTPRQNRTAPTREIRPAYGLR